MASVPVIVQAGDVKLKLSLTPKWMAKSFRDGLLDPFVKAVS